MSRHDRRRRGRRAPEPRGASSAWRDTFAPIVARVGRRRLGAALAIAALGVSLDLAYDSDYEGEQVEAAAAALASGSVAPAPPPDDPANLRYELGELPGTGHAGVTRFLERYGVTHGDLESEREFAVHLGKSLEGAAPAERLGAVRVLARLGPAAGAEALVHLAQDSEEEIRLTALRALGRVTGRGVRMALACLRAVAGDPAAGRKERFHAFQALSHIRARIDVDLVARVATEDTDPLLRLIACRTLLSRADWRGIAPLVDLLTLEASDACPPAEAAFAQREAYAALRAVASSLPAEPTASAWRAAVPDIRAALGAPDFVYVPETLYLPRAEPVLEECPAPPSPGGPPIPADGAEQ